jgi:hypothetical protein
LLLFFCVQWVGFFLRKRACFVFWGHARSLTFVLSSSILFFIFYLFIGLSCLLFFSGLDGTIFFSEQRMFPFYCALGQHLINYVSSTLFNFLFEVWPMSFNYVNHLERLKFFWIFYFCCYLRELCIFNYYNYLKSKINVGHPFSGNFIKQINT